VKHALDEDGFAPSAPLMTLRSGRQINPATMTPGDVDIRDIAHALSNICRYGGHVSRFYSVAEHSVLVATRVSPELRLAALLHDAAEAYVGDIPRPLKRLPQLAGWRKIEAHVERMVCVHFNLPPPPWPGDIHQIDSAIIVDEWAALMPAECDSGIAGEGIDAPCDGLSPDSARRLFLRWFDSIVGAP
jgi:hypothetical protein